MTKPTDEDGNESSGMTDEELNILITGWLTIPIDALAEEIEASLREIEAQIRRSNFRVVGGTDHADKHQERSQGPEEENIEASQGSDSICDESGAE